MGCDIHTVLEFRRDVDSPWEPITTIDIPHTDYKFNEATEEYDSIILPTGGSFIGNRSYGKFAILANVRNEGLYDLTPLDGADRGVPPDASSGITELIENWGCDLHSPTWYTLHELMIYNWDAEFKNKRQISPGQIPPVTTYRKLIGSEFWEHTTILTRWAKQNDIEPENIRIFMAFDN